MITFSLAPSECLPSPVFHFSGEGRETVVLLCNCLAREYSSVSCARVTFIVFLYIFFYSSLGKEVKAKGGLLDACKNVVVPLMFFPFFLAVKGKRQRVQRKMHPEALLSL